MSIPGEHVDVYVMLFGITQQDFNTGNGQLDYCYFHLSFLIIHGFSGNKYKPSCRNEWIILCSVASKDRGIFPATNLSCIKFIDRSIQLEV